MSRLLWPIPALSFVKSCTITQSAKVRFTERPGTLGFLPCYSCLRPLPPILSVVRYVGGPVQTRTADLLRVKQAL